MGELTKLQIHKHTFTYKKFTKSLKTECRFGIPFMPMKKTMILEPLLLTEINDVNSKNLIKITEDLVKRIRNNNLEDCFDYFLLQLNLNEEQYIYALRSSLKRVKVFLKRPLNSILVNNYNTEILY